jgi:chaperonin GroES
MMNSENQDMAGQASPPPQATEKEEPISVPNILDTLDEQEQLKIAAQCKEGFEEDLESRGEWESNIDDWIALAKQTKEDKTYPWPGASNVKYPLVTTAAMQFAARSYPSLVPSNGKIVNATVIGKDQTGQKYEKAQRVSTYMSYQVMHEMYGWEEDMDKMLMMLPIIGTMFKKTWYDKVEDKVKSKLVLPKNIVVNYWTVSLDETERISEVIHMSRRILKEKQNMGIYADVDLADPVAATNLMPDDAMQNSNSVPYTIIEQHTFLDLDDDGYAEPYIVTFEYTSGKLLRISRRYHLDDVKLKDDGKTIATIKPIQMYTKFGFIPNPDGSFYDIGFGILLGPINESVNTLINQLVDSGHLHNLQSGFIGKALRLKMGDQSLRPGEWRPVNATADDLRKQIVPLPTKEPSSVLFQLMGTLITSGKELASVAEIFTGKMPGQNTPATTTMATVEQGMKVFTAVYKRIFRALAEEFDKIFELNSLYLDPNKYVTVLDMEVGPDDFDHSSCDVSPAADPNAASQQEKLMKAQGLMEMLQVAGPIFNPVKVLSRVLEAQEQPNWQELFSDEVIQSGQVPPPPPDPKMMAIQAKMQADQQKAAIDMQVKQQGMELAGRSAEQKMAMEAQAHAQKMQMQEQSAIVKSASDIQMANIFSAAERAKATQGLVQKQQAHEQKLSQQKEVAKSTSKNGAKAK